MVEESESDAQADTGGVDVDPDVAPRTRDEVAVYLNVDGRIVITEADIHLAANDIAVLNGYMDLDYKVYTGDDPDWIYPGRTLRLPGTGDYVIRKGDTIWFLAAREVRVDVERSMAIYDNSLAVLENAASTASARTDATNALRDIAEGSKSAELRKMARNVL